MAGSGPRPSGARRPAGVPRPRRRPAGAARAGLPAAGETGKGRPEAGCCPGPAALRPCRQIPAAAPRRVTGGGGRGPGARAPSGGGGSRGDCGEEARSGGRGLALLPCAAAPLQADPRGLGAAAEARGRDRASAERWSRGDLEGGAGEERRARPRGVQALSAERRRLDAGGRQEEDARVFLGRRAQAAAHQASGPPGQQPPGRPQSQADGRRFRSSPSEGAAAPPWDLAGAADYLYDVEFAHGDLGRPP